MTETAATCLTFTDEPVYYRHVPHAGAGYAQEVTHDMQITYKCRNGHKFKKEEAPNVTCSSCGEPAEAVKWNTVESYAIPEKGLGVMDEINSVIKEYRKK